MELEVNVIKLENNLEYIIVDTIENNSNKYLFLSNKDDSNDACIRKVIEKDGKEFLRKLETEEELEDVIVLFSQKHEMKEGNNEK